jgi:hypothetical protein
MSISVSLRGDFKASQLRALARKMKRYRRQSRTALNWRFFKGVKAGFAKSCGDAPRCWASGSSFDYGEKS